MNNWIFEMIGIIAGICIALPSIPQIFQTRRTKEVKGLSPLMFGLLAMGTGCYFIYGRYLGSVSILIFFINVLLNAKIYLQV